MKSAVSWPQGLLFLLRAWLFFLERLLFLLEGLLFPSSSLWLLCCWPRTKSRNSFTPETLRWQDVPVQEIRATKKLGHKDDSIAYPSPNKLLDCNPFQPIDHNAHISARNLVDAASKIDTNTSSLLDDEPLIQKETTWWILLSVCTPLLWLEPKWLRIIHIVH